MPTLLLRCVAPLQAWDTQSNFGVRTTGREPSKSGIIGLLCAALGRPRAEPVADLAALKMGVRVDQEGRILRD
ncbi:MAG: type I-E CRISPR-associated protein Cas5/CasD, partial [Anaerolineae bacterium]